jgi:hypothetical protein
VPFASELGKINPGADGEYGTGPLPNADIYYN